MKYEMHLHSAPCSACSHTDILEQVTALKALGFAGAVVTNHFYQGYTGIDRALPWATFVDAYRHDYERAKRYGTKLDFDLFFGLEEEIGEGKEVLIYGVEPEWIAARPAFCGCGLKQLCDLVHEAGGLVVQAHPYREKHIEKPGVMEDYALLDGLEIYNAFNTAKENAKAAEFAQLHGLLGTAGTDAHSADEIGLAGIVVEARLKTNAMLVQVLKQGAYQIFHTQ